MSNTKPFIRWHDRQPRLAQAVKLLIMLPDEVKTIISESMISLANKEYDMLKKEGNVRSIGSEKIMSVHKSKNRRREYDDNETLHRAMNYLLILTDEGQDFMADHILNMVQFIHVYLQTCKEFKVNSKPQEIATITTIYVNSKSPGVEKFLKKLREEFYIKVFSPKGIKAPFDLVEAIKAEKQPTQDKLDLAAKDDNRGMKLSKQDLD